MSPLDAPPDETVPPVECEPAVNTYPLVPGRCSPVTTLPDVPGVPPTIPRDDCEVCTVDPTATVERQGDVDYLSSEMAAIVLSAAVAGAAFALLGKSAWRLVLKIASKVRQAYRRARRKKTSSPGSDRWLDS